MRSAFLGGLLKHADRGFALRHAAFAIAQRIPETTLQFLDNRKCRVVRTQLVGMVVALRGRKPVHALDQLVAFVADRVDLRRARERFEQQGGPGSGRADDEDRTLQRRSDT